MGERLNLEIKSQGKGRANAYYHWSGYTSSSYYIAKEAIASIDRIKVKDPILKAIRILEATGAGLTQHEKEEAKKLFPNIRFASCGGRNDGLIAISKEGMKETRQWEEARVTIDLDKEMVIFNAWWKDSKENWNDFQVAELNKPEFDAVPELKRSPYIFTSYKDFLDFFKEYKIEDFCYRYKNRIVSAKE